MTVARMLGVDVERLASDTAVLGTAGEALRERWAQVLALRARTQGLGLSEVGGGDDPLAVMAGLPERLRADLDVLDGIREAAEAAWHGVSAVCARLARLADEAADGVAGVFADPDADGADDLFADSGDEHPAAGYARAGLARIDGLLGELDGGPDADLVLIGGR
ncbi:MAG TPA: hypothetical protein PK331_03955 [Gordonia sp. (in: high G+C Gram-positive bacteria)]|uniref:hypothetical protein n=1 Tax=unclassified Gordonia (in: high G+C Gram-positive bacteria) TaxID=2657482 RepID=UPI0025C46632|nr:MULTISPECIES: hypothetical protein [unclassified Gordonia (in: high G+C Gram-positive bacteria)]HNP55361.1 hypothetical protein [Gordonia sp. (in: high G+C Gram-positive bacteria)]HRC50067.1 hypothetical protein [Gordonia sp. (in: high G+C Gram-positive bacteria)]